MTHGLGVDSLCIAAGENPAFLPERHLGCRTGCILILLGPGWLNCYQLTLFQGVTFTCRLHSLRHSAKGTTVRTSCGSPPLKATNISLISHNLKKQHKNKTNDSFPYKMGVWQFRRSNWVLCKDPKENRIIVVWVGSYIKHHPVPILLPWAGIPYSRSHKQVSHDRAGC